MEHASDFGLMTCRACSQPVVLTVEEGFCPRCYYRLECQAICAAAEDRVDRVFEEAFLELSNCADIGDQMEAEVPSEQIDWSAPRVPPPLGVEPSSEPAWTW
ncbi:MAG: hypothetical protein HYY06_14085 [Deltaproteobacteria bacterium]|nr:hypothetical protein [Deltaproteobacteria bacterium]